MNTVHGLLGKTTLLQISRTLRLLASIKARKTEEFNSDRFGLFSREKVFTDRTLSKIQCFLSKLLNEN